LAPNRTQFAIEHGVAILIGATANSIQSSLIYLKAGPLIADYLGTMLGLATAMNFSMQGGRRQHSFQDRCCRFDGCQCGRLDWNCGPRLFGANRELDHGTGAALDRARATVNDRDGERSSLLTKSKTRVPRMSPTTFVDQKTEMSVRTEGVRIGGAAIMS
jgi:hypothetical protein